MTPATRCPRIVTVAASGVALLALLAAAPLGALLGVGGTTAATAVAPTRPALQVIAEPQAGVAPFLTMIRDARSSVDLTMYELPDRGRPRLGGTGELFVSFLSQTRISHRPRGEHDHSRPHSPGYRSARRRRR